ncbi:MAG: alpha/beta hydrolase [Rhodospirillaceae bacterium]|nr:alpha/beta hydrolase [Rhodospirillaceae bacterium]MDD9917904.1 alpha/beta hydrolase [Rhodospirillaceae bacterium]MDD9928982.1 alpha/beta hydrolase [Rhodospirillaceae bacterium]
MFDFLTAQARAHDNLALHCGYGPVRFAIQCDDDVTYAIVDAAGVQLGGTPPGGGVDFTMAATRAHWAELFQDSPQPGFQTLSAMRRTQTLTVTGDMTKFFQHLMLLEMLFSGLSDDQPPAALDAPEIEPVTGRYLRLMLEGKPHRLYFEEAGEGVPLICLHTAGSDGRQFRHILNDSAVTDRFRVIAFDLPWHGKSSPPAGFESEVYELTTDRYMEIVLAVADALKLVDPVVMGCSIGGRAVLHLALRHGERFRAAIGLQSALYAEDRSLGDPQPEKALHRPDIHGGKLAGASMAGMIAPQSPSAERWETMWHYMQGGPGIFLGDIRYYFKHGDLRNGLADGLRDSPCPLYLLNGEYDPSATPEMGREVAELANAAHFEVMKGMGHFPMSENPALFRQYLLPVLDKILSA